MAFSKGSDSSGSTGDPQAASALWSFEAGAGAARSWLPEGNYPFHLSAEFRVLGGILGGRAGLIATLIQNAKQYSPSRIVGRLETIRDYVLVNDIGKFVAQCINRPAERPECFLLASGRPVAMCEVLNNRQGNWTARILSWTPPPRIRAISVTGVGPPGQLVPDRPRNGDQTGRQATRRFN